MSSLRSSGRAFTAGVDTEIMRPTGQTLYVTTCNKRTLMFYAAAAAAVFWLGTAWRRPVWGRVTGYDSLEMTR
jgi:hypothetical protein